MGLLLTQGEEGTVLARLFLRGFCHPEEARGFVGEDVDLLYYIVIGSIAKLLSCLLNFVQVL